jgi:very-short-patch-repair endonuclease
LEKKAKRTESPFEREVLERLLAANYDAQPQVWVGRYRLDFVLRSGATEVAVECDGDRYHDFDQIGEDMVRQAVLERAGWRFVRIRGTRFYRDREKTMGEVFDELRRLGISPDKGSVEDQPANPENVLRERIVRRAWEIMREQGWINEESHAHDEIGLE